MQNDLPDFHAENIIVVEHESHEVPATVNSSDASLKGCLEIVQTMEEHVGKYRAFQMPPEPLEQIQVRRVRGQPEDLDAVALLRQPLPDGLGVVEAAVVADQTDLASGVSREQCHQEGEEVDAAPRWRPPCRRSGRWRNPRRRRPPVSRSDPGPGPQAENRRPPTCASGSGGDGFQPRPNLTFRDNRSERQ
jgi:hypothetical protein